MQQGRMEGDTRVFDDHRDNLTVDVDNVLLETRAAQIRCEDSHVALTWNVFRALQRLDPGLWLRRLVEAAVDDSRRMRGFLEVKGGTGLEFHWWRRYDLPPSRHEWLLDAARHGNLHLDHYPARYLPEKKREIQRLLQTGAALEDPVEMPLTLETSAWALGVLAVYKGNLRRNARWDAHRDEILQALDAGSWYAHEHHKRFGLLVVYTDGRTYNTETRQLLDRYRGRPETLVTCLPHRRDRRLLAETAQRVGSLRWRDIGAALVDAKREERIGQFDVAILDELIKYLARKDLGFNFFRRLK